MSVIRITVEPEILRWVLRLAEEQHKDSELIEQINSWIAGEQQPTFNQLENLGKKTHVPFGYFFLKKPPVEKCDIVDYRTIDSLAVVKPSRELLDTLDTMTTAQEWMAEYNQDSGMGPNPFVGRAGKRQDTDTVADDIRSALNLGEDWFRIYRNADAAFKALRAKIMDLGILVMMNGVVGNNTHRKLSTNEFRAFTLIDPYAPLIFINSADSSNGRLFSLLHELVHVWRGKNSFYNDEFGTSMPEGKEERFCNAVATEILVPRQMFMTKWNELSGTAEERIAELHKYFVCSSFVLLRRGLECNLLSKEEYAGLTRLFEKRFREAQKSGVQCSGGDFYSTLRSRWDPNFVKALSSSAENGKTQYRDAYLMTNTTGKTFAALAEAVGGYEVG